MNLTTFPDRAAWLAARENSIGGSDAPVILGLSPYRTPLALWSQKVGILPHSDGTDIRLRIGLHVESAILSLLEEEAEVAIVPYRHALVAHPEFPDLTYSPDGLVHEAGGDVLTTPILGIAEVKNRAGFDAADDWAEEIPRDVYAQVQHGMDVLGLDTAWVGALLSGRDFRWAKVAKDHLWIAEKRPLLLDFARRVREGDPPPPTGHESDRAAIVARWPAEDVGKIVALPPDAIDLAAQYRDAKDAEKRAKFAADECANKLAVMLGDAEEGVLPGGFGKVTFRTTTCPARVQEAYSFRSPRVWLKKEKAR